MSKVIILTGSSGAGKSSAGEKLAKTLLGTWAFISQDGTRKFIKSGFKSPDEPWTDETKKQWEVSIAICSDMIKRYHQAEINCVVELFSPPAEFEKWRKRLKNIPYTLIVLLPNLEENIRRNANRKIPMKEFQVRENYEWFSAYKTDQAIILDTSHQTLAETVKHIKKNFIGHGVET